ncbi:(d)CMP kinase [Clostridium sp. E02]|uniref:(d)CMP kinase n=1 Tax=Clostridium sp. E02 TaxID=2487134 RepID=UPI000F52CF75|nr:(d)CMP kinase [Clostridium sp. E02]
MKKVYNIAIDGPAGAGKSTIARLVAEKLKFVYVDTGAMYRAMALYFLRKEISADDEAAVSCAAEDADVTIAYEKGLQQVILNGENVSSFIRSEEVGTMASATSGYLKVRQILVRLQKKLAEKENVIMDGRDIGTCVLPDADLKIYLTASTKVRAGRRYKQLTSKGIKCSLDEIEQEIIKRDYQDMNRANSPLKQAKDALRLDSSEMKAKDVVSQIVDLFEKKRTQEV